MPRSHPLFHAMRAPGLAALHAALLGVAACEQHGDPPPACTPTPWFVDLDGDGVGGVATVAACGPGVGRAAAGGDCHDGDAAVLPGAPEACNGYDDDCDDVVDEDDAVDAGTVFVDADGDGWGDTGAAATACATGAGWSALAGDCDDADAGVSPDGIETCDGRDEDCDGTADEEGADALPWHPDGDGDGFGDAEITVNACVAPPGWLGDDTDCGDADAAVYPGAPTGCGADHDCDTLLDDADPDVADGPAWYADADGDGHGNAAVAWAACAQPEHFVSADDDCDDTDAGVAPGADEHCDDHDEDCDGTADEDAVDRPSWYGDADGDGWGAGAAVVACDAPLGHVATDTDCDDVDAAVNPGAAEVCEVGDEDCDGLQQDADPDVSGAPTWYVDADGDGYGDPATAFTQCAAGAGVSAADDCDDTDGSVHPDAVDTCADGSDQDCWGGDQACTLEGEWSLASADARLDASGGNAGYSVGSAGDVDGDGLADLVIGAPTYDGGSTRGGGVFVVVGGATGTVDLDATATLLLGPSEGDYLGTATVGVGDLDGDGLGEVLVGGYFADPDYAGAAWLVRGATLMAATGPIDLGSADAVFPGEDPYDYAGNGASLLGDTDGDGVGDFLIAATGDSDAGYHAGATYLLRGADYRGTCALADAEAVLLGDGTGSHSGGGNDSAGDWNGDGLDDITIGAEADDTAGTLGGAAYVVLSPVTGIVSLGDADLRMVGEAPSEMAGTDVAGLGDTDGDGHPDLIVGAKSSSVHGLSLAGAAYVVRGPVTGDMTLDAADAILLGVAEGDRAGDSVAGPGDMDGDGLTDVVVGVWRDSTRGHHYGSASLFYGPVSGTLSLDDGDARFNGQGSASFAVDDAGDTDGDGLMDLLIGGPDAAGGRAWLVRGRAR